MSVTAIAKSSPAGVTREAQLVCDQCGLSTPLVEIGAAASDRAEALDALRRDSGFTEQREGWRGVVAPLGIGERPVFDLCRSCGKDVPS